MSTDPREYLNDNEEGQRLSLEAFEASLWTAMPAIVESVDLVKMTISCTIAIQGRMLNPDGSTSFTTIAPLLDVPIVFPSAGGFTITFPIAIGDEVLVVIASRCIDSWWQNGGTLNVPMEYRMHDLSDGYAIPGPKSQPNVIDNISATDVQIRNDEGTTYISITAAGKIKLVSPSEIDITGNLKVTGTISATGEVTGNSATTPITLTTHVHPGVTTGSGSTGGPTG
jgi:hypothetical protein